jgi:hypothetical protein
MPRPSRGAYSGGDSAPPLALGLFGRGQCAVPRDRRATPAVMLLLHAMMICCLAASNLTTFSSR